MIMKISEIWNNILHALKPAHTKPTFEWLTCTSRRYTFLYLALMLFFINQFHRLIMTIFPESRLGSIQDMYRIFIVSMVSFLFTCGLYIRNLDTIQDRLTSSLRWLLQRIRKLDPKAPWEKIVMTGLHCDDELQDIVVALNNKSSKIQNHINYLEKLIWFIQHEFNTPLAIAQLQLDRLKKKWLNDSKEYLWIQDELIHMKSLVEALVWLIKTKTEKFAVENVSITDTIQKVTQKLKVLHPEAHFEIDIQEDVIIKSNTQYIWAICRNICENALKHGSDSVHITLNKHQLLIEDNWPWIDKATLQKIRLPFWKKNPRAGQQEWFWLWLSLVKILVDKLKRKSEVTPWTSNWTVFSFTHTS